MLSKTFSGLDKSDVLCYYAVRHARGGCSMERNGALDTRGSFRLTREEWELFKEKCAAHGTNASCVLRRVVRLLLTEGEPLCKKTIFVPED